MSAIESIHERAMQALKTRFAAIVGDGGLTRWYTPDGGVLRFPAMTSECLNTPALVLYVLSPDEPQIEEGTLTMKRALAPIDLTLAARFSPPSEQPFVPPSVDRILTQGRLIQDATRALCSDATLGGLVTWTHIRWENRKAQDTYFEGWTLAFMRLEIEFYYADGAP